ncbi:hypothetical protein BDM02DRAFT_3122845 [Thelephora ganbajun]|uniref:Uncharacterized protein n=1 Tax=Thelephora ganbajun TaxID=370292 RepID=A0ACB6Z3Z0_THEGA|nr:hypothetical protein BDM02DRAFT_3122845 [Thelephora ganbajun]
MQTTSKKIGGTGSALGSTIQTSKFAEGKSTKSRPLFLVLVPPPYSDLLFTSPQSAITEDSVRDVDLLSLNSAKLVGRGFTTLVPSLIPE